MKLANTTLTFLDLIFSLLGVTTILTLILSDPNAIENVLGTNFDDTIIGNARGDYLYGGAGANLLIGGAGNDTLQGCPAQKVFLDFNSEADPTLPAYTRDQQQTILQRLTADYANFAYTFTLTPPPSGPYTTIYFNVSALRGIESYFAVSSWANVMPPSALIASSPSVPSVAVPDRITPMARSRWSWARASKNTSMERAGARLRWRGLSVNTPSVMPRSVLGGMT